MSVSENDCTPVKASEEEMESGGRDSILETQKRHLSSKQAAG